MVYVTDRAFCLVLHWKRRGNIAYMKDIRCVVKKVIITYKISLTDMKHIFLLISELSRDVERIVMWGKGTLNLQALPKHLMK